MKGGKFSIPRHNKPTGHFFPKQSGSAFSPINQSHNYLFDFWAKNTACNAVGILCLSMELHYCPWKPHPFFKMLKHRHLFSVLFICDREGCYSFNGITKTCKYLNTKFYLIYGLSEMVDGQTFNKIELFHFFKCSFHYHTFLHFLKYCLVPQCSVL